MEPASMALEIQTATIDHLDAILARMRQMQEDDPWSEAFDEAVVRANLTALLANPAYGVICVAQDGGVPVGYVVVCFDYSLEYRGKGAWVDELFVALSHRGKGIATQLLEVAEKAAAEHGAKYLHLEVSHGNPAIELYRRRGFVDHQRYLMTKRIAE
jgi:GNAT superfamily N-acetyltransferase